MSIIQFQWRRMGPLAFHFTGRSTVSSKTNSDIIIALYYCSFVRWIPLDSLHKGPLMWKMFPCRDVTISNSCFFFFSVICHRQLRGGLANRDVMATRGSDRCGTGHLRRPSVTWCILFHVDYGTRGRSHCDVSPRAGGPTFIATHVPAPISHMQGYVIT